MPPDAGRRGASEYQDVVAGAKYLQARARDPRPGAPQGMSADERKLAFDSSPVAAVKTWKSPVLFIHGDDDRNVDFSQTVDLVQKLRAKGDVHVELMVRPDEPHEFLLHKNRLDAYNATFEFLNRFIGKK